MSSTDTVAVGDSPVLATVIPADDSLLVGLFNQINKENKQKFLEKVEKLVEKFQDGGCEKTFSSEGVVGSTALGMLVLYVVGFATAKYHGAYQPGTLPILNLIGAAFLLCTLFDDEMLEHIEEHVSFKKNNTTNNTTNNTGNIGRILGRLSQWFASRKQLWVLLGTLLLLVVIAAISSSSSSLNLQVKVKVPADKISAFETWVKTTAKYSANDPTKVTTSQNMVTYTTTIESNRDIEDVVNEIENSIPTNTPDPANRNPVNQAQVINLNVSKPESISVGLIVAVVINFMLDGLMVAGETCTKGTDTRILTHKIGGFMCDNLILMMILGYQLTRAKVGAGWIVGGCIGFVLVFAISMGFGLTEKTPWNKVKHVFSEETVTTITFAVVVYTIFVELMPEATVFRDFDGNLIDAEEGGVKNYESVVMPIVFFLAVLAYRTVAG